jgi:hypothetical protein
MCAHTIYRNFHNFHIVSTFIKKAQSNKQGEERKHSTFRRGEWTVRLERWANNNPKREGYLY